MGDAPIRNFEQQRTAAHDQLFRTLGTPVSYKNGAGVTKNIIAIFRNKGLEQEDLTTRIVSGGPVLRARQTDINDRDRDTATLTVNGTTYRPDEYIEDGQGLIRIYLRA